ncbi:hypothetical protein AHAS_Ahas19G0316700 [Arachis hypogaea]
MRRSWQHRGSPSLYVYNAKKWQNIRLDREQDRRQRAPKGRQSSSRGIRRERGRGSDDDTSRKHCSSRHGGMRGASNRDQTEERDQMQAHDVEDPARDVATAANMWWW